MKIWYTFHTDSHKQVLLRSELDSAGLYHVKLEEFESSMEEHNPFYHH